MGEFLPLFEMINLIRKGGGRFVTTPSVLMIQQVRYAFRQENTIKYNQVDEVAIAYYFIT